MRAFKGVFKAPAVCPFATRGEQNDEKPDHKN